jgi:hypothetical protein
VLDDEVYHGYGYNMRYFSLYHYLESKKVRKESDKSFEKQPDIALVWMLLDSVDDIPRFFKGIRPPLKVSLSGQPWP